MLPLWGFHTTLGYVYGTAVGGTMVAATQAVCAGAAFMCSRHVARPYISGYLERKYGRKYRAIDAAVGKQGLRITILLRLSPIIPFGINNYVCGVTSIKLWQWVVGTFVGVFPGTMTYCHMGALGKAAMSDGATLATKAVMGLSVCAGLGAVYYLNKVATDALREAGIDDEEDDEDEEEATATL